MSKPGIDPIFAVIAMHRAAVEEFSQAVAVSGSIAHGDPNFIPADNTTRAAAGRVSDTLRDVLTTRPTTLEGISAVLEHAALPEFLTVEPGAHETVLSTCANADEEIKRAAQDFPARLAETMRSLIASSAIDGAAKPR